MIYVEALSRLKEDTKGTTLFLAGGITNCPLWQETMVKLLGDTDFVLLNPRRANFPIGDPSAALEQVTWEHRHLRLADAILFWFPAETLCPIVLFELGAWTMTDKLIFVGVHPEYARRKDVEIQTRLARPEIEVVYSLEDLARQVVRKEKIMTENKENKRSWWEEAAPVLIWVVVLSIVLGTIISLAF